MSKTIAGTLLAGYFLLSFPLRAQQVCPGFIYVANSAEDILIQAVSGAENPQEQVAALDKYAQEHADSKFMPCVDEYYTVVHLKANNYDKVIEYGEKALAGNYLDMMIILNVTKAYVASNKVSDTAFDIIMKAPEKIKAEANPQQKPAGVSDADWQKQLQELADAGKDQSAYMQYAFFQLLPRLADPKKKIAVMDQFEKAYPDNTGAAQLNYHYFLSYKMTGDAAKADEYGEKAIATDPNNPAVYNLVADDYASRQVNLDKANEYAKKVIALVPAMKKPDNASDDQFKAYQNTQLGLAHLTLGYVAFTRAGKTRKVAPAIQEFNTATQLLSGNPELLARGLFYLGNAYEFQYPPNHHLAVEVLTRASEIQGPWQGQARDLLAKVKAAAR